MDAKNKIKSLIFSSVEDYERMTFTELESLMEENGFPKGEAVLSLPGYEKIYIWMNLDEEVKTALEELILEDKIQLLHASENFDAIMLLDRTETGHPLRSKFPLAFGPKRVKKPHWMPHWIAIKAIKD